MSFEHFLQYEIFYNSVESYLQSLGILFILFIGMIIAKKITVKHLQVWAKKSTNRFDDFAVELLEEINLIVFFVISLFIAVQNLDLSTAIYNIIFSGFIIAITYQGIKYLKYLINFSIKNYASHLAEKHAEPVDEGVVKFVITIINIILWCIGILLIISNLGYEISSLLAGLGIGGIAFALASQSVLGNIFNSLSIIIDKPFKVGDFIVMGEEMGTIKEIGLRSTRIQTLRGEELILPNSDITNGRIHNFKRMQSRRITFQIGVAYETDLSKLKKIPEIILEIIKKQEFTAKDDGSMWTYFINYGEYSLVFDILYYVVNSDYAVYLKTQQSINFDIAEAFQKEGISFAYPSRNLYIKERALS